MTYETIIYDLSDGVGKITMNRPERLNAFNALMLQEMADVLSKIAKDKAARCLMLTGEGRGFSPGQDLNDRKVSPGSKPPQLSDTLEKGYYPVIRGLRGLKIPTVAAVNGVAAGAGANIAFNCDIVIATESAKFIQAFCKIGLIPDCGGTYLLPRLVGLARAKGLAMLGDALTAKDAEHWGLIWKCVADNEFADYVQKLCAHLATQPTFGLGLIKGALDQSLDNDFEAQLALEKDYQQQGANSEDYREGVSAFLEKRSPQFKGK